jgi:hypothetical protein
MESPTFIVLSSSSLEDNCSTFDLPFKFSLPETETWNIALSEISLLGRIVNVRNDFIRIEDTKHSFNIILFDGFYKEVRDIFRTIKWLWREHRVPRRFSPPEYDLDTGMMKFTVLPYQTLTVSDNLVKLLKLSKCVRNTSSDPIVMESSKVLNNVEESENVCVLSNLVEERFLGNGMMSLLTTITIQKDNPWGINSFSPGLLEYLKVKPGVYKKICVELRKTDGEMLKYISDNILLKLKLVRI